MEYLDPKNTYNSRKSTQGKISRIPEINKDQIVQKD